jgi:hypothetical protein
MASIRDSWTPYTDPSYRKDQCLFADWPACDRYTFIERDHIREQSQGVKANLFGGITSQHQALQEAGRQTLERLKELDAAGASHFETKPSLVDGMTFRLFNGESSDSPESYIALSYCWPQTSFTIEAEPPNMIRVPLDPLLFQQLIVERKSATEGIWCDKLCINQEDKHEKNWTVSAMDAIYKCARLVVVALEDIEVTAEERRFLEEFAKDYADPRWPPHRPPHFDDTPPFMAQHPVLHRFFFKICGSRYFTRAWCSHELRLGRAHLFIMKCSSSQPTNTSKVCAFTGQFLGYLVGLSSRLPSPEAETVTTTSTLDRVFDWNKAMNNIYNFPKNPRLILKDDKTVELYSPQIMEVFALGAGGDPNALDRERDANLDRMAIVLNSMGSGITLNRVVSATSPRTVSRDHCIQLLLLVALAAGDPTALCTMGKPLEFGGAGQSSSWLCATHFADVGMGGARHEALPPMRDFPYQLDPSPLAEWIHLDCLPLGKPERVSDRSVATAAKIIDKCGELGFGAGLLGIMGLGPQFNFWRSQVVIPEFQQAFRLTVAAILDLSPRWLLGMAPKCGFNDFSVTQEMRSAISTHFPDGFDQEYLDSLSWAASKSASNAVNWILKTAHFMKAMLHTYLPSCEAGSWIPFILSPGWSKKVLILGPSNALVRPVIPAALLKAEYSRLPRVWLLQDTGDPWDEKMESLTEGQRPRMFIRAKSVLYGNPSEDEYQSQLQGPRIGRGMWIHGRLAAAET